MHRLLEYHITDTDKGLSVKQYLKAKGYSSQNITQLKKTDGNVQADGHSVYMTYRLSPGEILTIRINENTSSENILPAPLPIHIVYEDNDLMVLNKPAGMPTHPSMNNHDNSLANALAWYFREQEIPFVFRCISRLDRDTSGLTVVAKHMVSASILSGMLHSGSSGIRREYLGIVRGSVSPPQGTITAPLSRKPGSVIERTVDFERGEPAVTHYRVLKEGNGHSLISLCLETGRTHQIRIHMKYIGYPLIGDYLYNPDMEHISRQALHSGKLTFLHPITGEIMKFTAPMPKDMQNIFKKG